MGKTADYLNKIKRKPMDENAVPVSANQFTNPELLKASNGIWATTEVPKEATKEEKEKIKESVAMRIAEKKQQGEEIVEIEIEKLVEFTGKRGRKQPFKPDKNVIKSLEESIKDIGLTTPLVVRPKKDMFQIISGHHRYRACTNLGFKTIPCIVRDINDDLAEKYLIECNVQRIKLNPSEYGQILKRYMEIKNSLDLTVAEVAMKYGIAPKTLYRYVHVSELTDSLQTQVDWGRINVDVAEVISPLPEDKQERLNELISENEHKHITRKFAAKVFELFNENCLNDITEEKYLECFEVPKTTYKNKIYEAVYNKYEIPATEKIPEEEIDSLVSDYVDKYFAKKFQIKNVLQPKITDLNIQDPLEPSGELTNEIDDYER